MVGDSGSDSNPRGDAATSSGSTSSCFVIWILKEQSKQWIPAVYTVSHQQSQIADGFLHGLFGFISNILIKFRLELIEGDVESRPVEEED